MGHEFKNPLALIKSIAGSLKSRLGGTPLPAADRQDFQRGRREIIETRAASLNRFLQAYRQLAQMPPPVLRVDALRISDPGGWIGNRALQSRWSPGLDVLQRWPTRTKFEQMLINLVRNATEAALEAMSTEKGQNGDRPRSVIATEPEVTITGNWSKMTWS